jgi:hypothetical protein
MKFPTPRISAILPVVAGFALSSIGFAEEAPTAPADPGWPREFSMENKKLYIYQPQVDEWKDHHTMYLRCAVEIEGVLAEPKFGVAEIEARTIVDQEARTVQLFPTKRDLRFAGVSEEEQKTLMQAFITIRPPQQNLTVSLDRVLASLDAETAGAQKQVDVSLAPPKIYYSNTQAVLVMFMGEPQLKPVVAADPDLMFAINTNWDVFYQPSTKAFFLLNGDHWLTAPAVDGAWSAATSLPDKLKSLPEDENWAEVRKHVPGKKSESSVKVFTATQPAELLMTSGEPAYSPISNTKLLEITNTESLLILDSAGGRFYYQVAGRWFRAPKLEGPWEAASSDLPDDFAKIPDNHSLAFVKASVPGTEEAEDAVLLASVPQTTTVDITKPPTLEVTYKGQPNFQPIPSTTVKYAVNSPYSVFLVEKAYYCCDQGVWFTATVATGPWAWCKTVPDAIYTIPVASPAHHVTYATVKESSPDTVVYAQTSGYSGEYVATNGVLMFGAGVLVGSLINDCHVHYCYPPASYYSYGCGAVYHYGYGGYYAAAGAVYGPYGGTGYAAAYNPNTGIYSRGAYAYGPYGSAGYRQAYNPYTGTYAAAGYRATPYGTVEGGRAYNPYTGATAAGGRVSTAYGSAGRAAAYNPVTGKAATGGYVSGGNGSAAGVRTNQGTGAAAWDTQQGQGAVAKTRNDNVYAAHDGNVYKKDENGNWSTNTGSGWEPADPSQSTRATSQTKESTAQRERPATSPENSTKPREGATTPRENSTTPRERPDTSSATRERTSTRPTLDSTSRSRERGTTLTERTKTFQRSGNTGESPRGGSGGNRRSGGGERRR